MKTMSQFMKFVGRQDFLIVRIYQYHQHQFFDHPMKLYNKIKPMEKGYAKIDLQIEGELVYEEAHGQKKIQKDFGLKVNLKTEGLDEVQKQYQVIIPEKPKANSLWNQSHQNACKFMIARKQTLSLEITLPEENIMIQAQENFHQLLANQDGKMEVTLKDDKNERRMRVVISWVQNHDKSKLDVVMNWSANHLPDLKSGFINSTNSYLRFLKCWKNGTCKQLYKTEKIENSTSPKWSQFEIQLGKLFDMSLQLPHFKIECWHQCEDKEQILIGEVRVNYNTFKTKQQDNQIFVMNNSETKEFRGNLLLSDRDIRQPDTFLNSGLRLNYIAIFSLSEKTKNNKIHTKFIAECIKDSWKCLKQFSTLDEQGEKQMSVYGIGKKKYFSMRDLLLIPNASSVGEGYQISGNVIEQKSSQSTEGIEERRKSNNEEVMIQDQNPSEYFSIGKGKGKISKEQMENLQDLLASIYENGQKYEDQIYLAPLLKQLVEKWKNQKNYESYNVCFVFVNQQFQDFQEALEIIQMTTTLPFSFLFLGLELGNPQLLTKLQILNKGNASFRTNRPMTSFMSCKNMKESDFCWRKLLSQFPEHVATYIKEQYWNSKIQE